MRYNHSGVLSRIDDLPGNGQVAVFNYVFTPSNNRGRGSGRIAHEARLDEARRLGYDYAICTMDSDNEIQRKILVRFKWKFLFSFMSSRTGHIVSMFGKELN